MGETEVRLSSQKLEITNYIKNKDNEKTVLQKDQDKSSDIDPADFRHVNLIFAAGINAGTGSQGSRNKQSFNEKDQVEPDQKSGESECTECCFKIKFLPDP